MVMDKKLLLVTFPVDLGNTTYETRLINLFKNKIDLKVYRFNPDEGKTHPTSSWAYSVRIGQRLLASVNLQRSVFQAYHKEGRKVLFQGVSPALFALPTTPKNTSFIVTDWTRKLYEPIYGIRMSNSLETRVHRTVLDHQKKIMGLTDAVVNEIADDYQIPSCKLAKVRLPFYQDLETFTPSINREDNEIRLLFVGGAFQRKGGHCLVKWFKDNYSPNLKLTLMTNHPIEPGLGIKVIRNVRYGEKKHVETFSSHDIFVLPTSCDGYPSVLGEAASAGLAILTTKNALGAPEVIRNGLNGFISESREALLNQLSTLIINQSLINKMKWESRNLIERNFSSESTVNEYLSCIFE